MSVRSWIGRGSAPVKPRDDSRWAWGIAIGLTCTVAINIVMVGIAMKHPSALASSDHYAEAARTDAIAAERAAARDLAWDVTLEPCAARSRARTCDVVLSVHDRHGRPVESSSGTVTARRADDTRFDATCELASIVAGEYRCTLRLEGPAYYDFDVRLEGADVPWVGRTRALVAGEMP